MNPTAQDLEFALFSNEKVATSIPALIIFSPSVPLAGVYNPSNGYYYRTRLNDNIAVTDRENNVVGPIVGNDNFGDYGIYNPINQTVYFSTYTNKIIAIQGLSLTEIPTPGIPGFPVFCPINGSVYFSNTDPIATSLYKVAPDNTLTFIPVPATPAGELQESKGVYFPAEQTLLFPSYTTNEMYVFDPGTDTWNQSLPLPARAREGVYFPSTGKVIFSSYSSQLFSIASGYAITALNLPAGEQAAQGTYSVSDNYVYFISDTSQSQVYAIDTNEAITSIPVNFPTTVTYNTVDKSTYVSTTTGLQTIRNAVILNSQNIVGLTHSTLNTDTGSISYAMTTPSRIFYTSTVALEFDRAKLSLINQEVGSGAFRIQELKILSTEAGQFNYPIQLERSSLTGRKSLETIFPMDHFGDSFGQNVVTLKDKDLDDFVASDSNSMRIPVMANSTLSLIFKGELVKPGDLLNDKNKIEYYE